MPKVPRGVPVSEPREVDVLCGRGGLSNYHPGNEWYRRLIRSNRPLYRACPKHTKLLVSKAIVQAVEQQGGRFLEKDKFSGDWYQVPYKRAVDKASQALREKEREEGDDDDDNTMENVPEGFRGNNTAGSEGPNLSDLAEVAMAHANQSENKGQQKRQAPSQQGLPQPNKRQRKATAADRNHHSIAPSPPALQDRQSSMYRLLRQTQLLPGATTELIASSRSFQEATSPQLPTKLQNLDLTQMKSPTFQQQHHQPGMFSLFRNSNHHTTPTFHPMEHNVVTTSQPPAPAAVAPPPLARLTSQVSDWLQSFWPLNRTGHDDVVPPEIQNQLKIPAPVDLPQPPAIHMVPPPKQPNLEPVPWTRDHPFHLTTDQYPLSYSTAAAAAARGETPLPVTFAGLASKESEDLLDVDLSGMPPTELEQSVSTSLLKLASSPSKLLTGLTSALFGPSEADLSNGDVSASIPPPPPLQMQSALPRIASPSKKSLLEDYEETPDEARLRSVASN